MLESSEPEKSEGKVLQWYLVWFPVLFSCVFGDRFTQTNTYDPPNYTKRRHDKDTEKISWQSVDNYRAVNMNSSNASPVRRRFVIDLNRTAGEGTQPRRASRRWSKILLVLAIVVVLFVGLAAGGVYFWWQSYKTTPAYSLALLLDAFQHKELSIVEQIIDTNQIIDNLAPRISEKAVSRYGVTLNSARRRRVEAMVPALLPKVKEGAGEVLAKWVEEMFAEAEPKPFVVLALGLPYLVNITSDGDIANVAVPVKDGKVEFVMRRSGKRWKIVGINDDAIVDRIVDDIISKFPAVGQVK
jgi:hypothetical protein